MFSVVVFINKVFILKFLDSVTPSSFLKYQQCLMQMV